MIGPCLQKKKKKKKKKTNGPVTVILHRPDIRLFKTQVLPKNTAKCFEFIPAWTRLSVARGSRRLTHAAYWFHCKVSDSFSRHFDGL